MAEYKAINQGPRPIGTDSPVQPGQHTTFPQIFELESGLPPANQQHTYATFNEPLKPASRPTPFNNVGTPLEIYSPMRAEAQPIVINLTGNNKSGFGKFLKVALLGSLLAAGLEHKAIANYIDNSPTAGDYRDKICTQVTDASLGSRGQEFFDNLTLNVGCKTGKSTAPLTSSVAIPVTPEVQAALPANYTSPTFTGGDIILAAPPEIPVPGHEATIKVAKDIPKVGDIFNDATFVGTDAEPFVETTKPTLEGFKQFWANVDTSDMDVFHAQLADTGRLNSHIVPTKLVVHWTAGGGTINNVAHAMVGRRGTPDCGDSGCDVQFMLGREGDEDGKLAILTPAMDTKAFHAGSQYNGSSLGVEIIANPQGPNNTKPNYTDKQMTNLAYLIVGLHALFPTIPIDETGVVGHSDISNERYMEPGSGIVELALRNAGLFYQQYKNEVSAVVERQKTGDFSPAQIDEFKKQVDAFQKTVPPITPQDAIKRLVAHKGGTYAEKFGPTQVPPDIAFMAMILAGWDVKNLPDAYAVFKEESAWYPQAISEIDLGLKDAATGQKLPPINTDGTVNVVGSFGPCQENYGQINTTTPEREPTKHLNGLVYALKWCKDQFDGRGGFSAWGAFTSERYKKQLPEAAQLYSAFIAKYPLAATRSQKS